MDRSSPLSASPDSRHHSPPRRDVDKSSSPPRGLERGMIKLPEPLNNPHWRPPPDSRNPQWRRGEGDWRNGQNSGAPSGWSGGPTQQPPSSGWCSAPSTHRDTRDIYTIQPQVALYHHTSLAAVHTPHPTHHLPAQNRFFIIVFFLKIYR